MFGSKKYNTFLRASMMNMLIYRGNVILWILVDIFKFFMLVFLWQAVYQNKADISGFLLGDMILYFLISGMTAIFSNPGTHYDMSDEIRQGRISLYLIKPLSYKRRLFYESIGRNLALTMIIAPIAIILTITVSYVYGIAVNIGFIQVIGFLAYLPFIVAFCFEYSFLFGTLMIYTQNNFGLSILMVVLSTALSGQLVPLALYPESVQGILQILPFKFISYPPLIFINKVMPMEMLTGLAMLTGWIIVFKLINFVFFRIGLKKMVVFGG